MNLENESVSMTDVRPSISFGSSRSAAEAPVADAASSGALGMPGSMLTSIAPVMPRGSSGADAGYLERPVATRCGSPDSPWIHDPDLIPAGWRGLARAFRFVGHLDERALDRGLQGLLARHAVLRTLFRGRDGQLPGTVLRGASAVMPVVQIERFGVAQRERDLRRLVAEAVEEPFDLAHPPLLRAQLFQTGARERTLCLMVHRVVADAAPIARLSLELEAAYLARPRH